MEEKKLKRDLKRRPNVAWPTIFIFLGSLFVSALSVAIGTGIILPFELSAYDITNIKDIINLDYSLYNLGTKIPITLLCLIISSLSSYAMFTVTHDAIHRSISKNLYLNDTLGYFSHLWLGPTSNWYGMKINHLLHHKHTNDEENDPDMWCSEHGPGGNKYILFRWMTLDFAYWYYLYPIFLKESLKSMFDFIGYECVILAIIALSVQFNFLNILIQYWIIPSRFAIFILSYAFDYLPHYPHKIKRSENKYLTTSYISGPNYIRYVLSALIFYQNYHIIHHLYPQIPFYNYISYWKLEKNELISKHNIDIKRFLSYLGEENLEPSASPKNR